MGRGGMRLGPTDPQNRGSAPHSEISGNTADVPREAPQASAPSLEVPQMSPRRSAGWVLNDAWRLHQDGSAQCAGPG